MLGAKTTFLRRRFEHLVKKLELAIPESSGSCVSEARGGIVVLLLVDLSNYEIITSTSGLSSLERQTCIWLVAQD